jgi:hypothetical protein
MKQKLFSDILELVDAIKQHPFTVVCNDNIENDPPSIGFLASDGLRFAITLEDLQSSLKNYPPNTSNRKIALFTSALKTDKGKENFCKAVNEGKEDKSKSKKEDQYKEIISKIDEPEGQTISDDNFSEKLISILDDCTKDLLTTISSMSKELFNKWKDKNSYSRLLNDVLNGDGPKELWLKVVLDHLEEHGGNINK